MSWLSIWISPQIICLIFWTVDGTDGSNYHRQRYNWEEKLCLDSTGELIDWNRNIPEEFRTIGTIKPFQSIMAGL